MNTRLKTVMRRLSVFVTLILSVVHVYRWIQLGDISTTNQVFFLTFFDTYILPFSVPRLADIAIGFTITPMFVFVTWYMYNQFDNDTPDMTKKDFVLVVSWFSVLAGYISGLVLGIFTGLVNVVVLPVMVVATVLLGYYIMRALLWGWKYMWAYIWAYDKK